MHLSPLSVPYRIARRGGSIVAAAAFAVFSGAMSQPFGLAGPAAVVALLGVLVLAFGAYEVAYYQRYRYELTADTLDISSGVVARRDREIPVGRIQNVDISRNVVQRALGIAAVDFETAGGGETEAAIRYVSYDEAKRLQREVARRKRGLGGETGAAAEDDDAVAPPADVETEELFALSPRELALVGALSFDFRIPGFVFLLGSGSIPVVTQFLPQGSGLVLAGGVGLLVLALVAFSWLAGAAVSVVNYWGFRLSRAGDELHYERGLLQRYDGSIPLDKIQMLTIRDSPLTRYVGYASLDIETAGYRPGRSDDRGAQSAVPLATRERVDRLANDIEAFGSPDFERPPRRVRRRYAVRYLLVLVGLLALAYGVARFEPRGLALPFRWYLVTLLGVLIPLAAHLKWLHRGYWLGEHHVVTRNGVLDRRITVVPYYRIQTVIDSRTVFQRRLRLATVEIDTAGSRSLVGGGAAAVDVDGETADRLRERLTERLEAALSSRRSERASRKRAETETNDAASSTGDDTETPAPSDPAPADDDWQWLDDASLSEGSVEADHPGTLGGDDDDGENRSTDARDGR